MKVPKLKKTSPAKTIPPRRQPGRRAATHNVHFELANPSASRVCVAGTFNNWKPDEGEMKCTRGKWIKDLSLKPGTYEYRLVVDGRWMPDPGADHSVVNPFGERNSLVTVA